MAAFYLAQLNIARLAAPLDSPQLSEFVANLERINQLAEAAPGFVWRLQDEAGDAVQFRPFGDDYLINMSMWQDVESLWQYVYLSGHMAIMRRRREWFLPLSEAHAVLWWQAAAERPTVADAAARLALLREHGPTPQAFTFKQCFAMPEPAAIT